MKTVAVIGGGPAGLRAAEVISTWNIKVELFDGQPSVGRKLLVAGKGGLNLTHSEPFENFWHRYYPEPEKWKKILEAFSPKELETWAHGLGVETYIGSSRRVYPVGNQAGRLLRNWVHRLKSAGVHFHCRHQWIEMENDQTLTFQTPEGNVVRKFDCVIFTLGGASWPKTGSTGGWVKHFEKHNISVNPLLSSNCGFSIAWPEWFIEKFDGVPLKNIIVTFAGNRVPGDLMITKNGIEGTPIYHLSRFLRETVRPKIGIDLKPDWSVSDLLRRWKPARGFMRDIERSWKLSPVAKGLLSRAEPNRTPEAWAARVKACPIQLEGARPIEEAISTAGGVAMHEFDENLQLKKIPGVYCAGEMLDWEAPTGGYLLQGCFASGTVVGNAVGKFLSS